MKLRLLIFATVLLVAATLPTPSQQASQQSTGSAADSPGAAQAALIQKYCVGCHNDRAKTAGLSLEAFDATHPDSGEAALAAWENVIRKVRVGMMPPQSAPHPPAADRAALVSWLQTELDRADALHPGPGSPMIHRLNRAEYENAIRDLLDLEVDASTLLPPDDAAFGFDNNAETLGVSPVLVEQYLSAAGKVSSLAVGDPTTGAAAQVLRVPADESQDVPVNGMPVGTEGGQMFHVTLPLDGEYRLDVKYIISNLGAMKGLEFPNEFEITVDGKRVHSATIGGTDDFNALMANITSALNAIQERSSTRVPLTAGPHDIGAGFVYNGTELRSVRLQPFVRSNQDNLDATGHPHIELLTVTGPFHPTGSSSTPSRERIFTCRPDAETPEPSKEELACAREILSSLSHRAYRGADTPQDLGRLMDFFAQGRKRGGFETGIQIALERILASPKFTFRVERDESDLPPGTIHPISDLELASRLSFFLWSSIPDDELLDVATEQRLSKPEVLEAQVRRMLADPKARALVENFAGQWLYLRNLDGMLPNTSGFPDFDDNLRQAFHRETELFFESILHEDRSVLDLMTADYTFLNERLAKHYGIDHIYGSHFRRVKLSDPARFGLLGKGSTLMVSSHTDRTSPVVRGKWVLENLLGTPPPPPPANVPPFNEDANREGRILTMRERMAEHRANPVCAGCHQMMDPIGLSLENFNAVGAWRDYEAGSGSAKIDASGTLLDGTEINGPVELREALLKKPEIFVSTMTEKLMIYALGRGLTAHDMPDVRKIVRDAAKSDYRFSELILGVVRSVPFQMRAKPAPAEGSGTEG